MLLQKIMSVKLSTYVYVDISEIQVSLTILHIGNHLLFFANTHVLCPFFSLKILFPYLFVYVLYY